MKNMYNIMVKTCLNISKKIKIHARKKYWNNYVTNCIKEEKQIKKLTKEQIENAKKYFKPYNNINSKFHQFYYQKTGKYFRNYIPDDLYYCYIDPYYNNWNEAEYIDNKCYYQFIFPKAKQPETLACRINKLWFDRDMNLIDLNKVKMILNSEKECFMKKAVNSEGGHGVYYLYGNISKEFEKILPKVNDDIIIQKCVKQHEELNKLNSSSINTIRILSLLSEEGVKVYSVILRMGINGAKVDNASSGGITCGINNDGTLKDVAYSSSGTKYYEHPTSEMKFKNIKIPNFNNAISMIKNLHQQIPHFRLVSWDIAIEEDGEPILIEANLKYGELDFHQLNNGPVFGNDTEKILKEVFSK